MTDYALRALERAARDGDADAAARLVRVKARAGIRETAAELAEVATDLAKRLNKAPACREVGCWRHAQTVLKEKTRTPFPKWNPERMCDACAAMWHVSMAEIRLRQRAHDDAEDAARESVG